MAVSSPASEPLVSAAPGEPDLRLAACRRAAVVPAYNEASIAGVIAEIRAVDPGWEIIVAGDVSFEKTAVIAAEAGARVLRRACNLELIRSRRLQTALTRRVLPLELRLEESGPGQAGP